MPELEAFFHDLRALRAGAGLSLAELAERAHFPAEALAAAETGPAVPPNPVLVAYVQACGGPVGQWEDRWRNASAAAASGFLTLALKPADTPPAHSAARAPGATRRRRGRCRHAGRGRNGRRTDAPRCSHFRSHSRQRQAADLAECAPARHIRARPHPGRSPSPVHPAASAPQMTSVLQVTGVGCPPSRDSGVTLTAAGPGRPWTAAQGGWAGNGCDGAAVWTMNPAGKQPSPSTLTWWFGALPGVSRCTLSVYVPTQNALGEAGYVVSAGSGGSLGTVSIDQAADAGYWVVLGTFPASGSGYQIQLIPEVTELTAAGPAAKGPGNPAAKPVPPGHNSAAPPGHNSAIAASAAATACSGSPG